MGAGVCQALVSRGSRAWTVVTLIWFLDLRMLAGVCQALVSRGSRAWTVVTLIRFLDLRCGLPVGVRDLLGPRGCGEGGYLDSRTLGDAGVRLPGLVSRGSRAWTVLTLRFLDLQMLADICQAF